MATTTKKSKAKSKTTKKTVRTAQAKVNPASRSEAGRAKKTVSKKAVKVVKTKSVKKPYTDQLNKLNLASGVLGLVLAAVAGFFMRSNSIQIFTGMLTKDQLASQTGTVFVPAIHSVYDIQLRWAVVVILVLSSVIPLLAATRNRKQYEASLAKKVMLWRWIDMSVISALILGVVALLSGVQDFMTLKFIAAFMVIVGVLSWFSEKRNASASKADWDNYILSLFVAALPWVMIAVYAVGTGVYGMVRSPWYTYALYATTLVAFIGYALNGKKQLQAKQDYQTTERNYLLLSTFAKTAFAIVLIAGLYK